MIKINDITFSEGGNGWEKGIIYLNNRSLTNKFDYILSFQAYDRIIGTAMLSENQVIELIKSLEMLLVTKES